MVITKATKFACDFCAKDQDELQMLVRGPRDICICGECVALCNEIIAEKLAEKADSATTESQGA